MWAVDTRKGTWCAARARDPQVGGRYFQVVWEDGATSEPIALCHHGYRWYFEDEWRAMESRVCGRGLRAGDGVSIESLTGKFSTRVSRVDGEGLATTFQVRGKGSTRYLLVGDDRWARQRIVGESSVSDASVSDVLSCGA